MTSKFITETELDEIKKKRQEEWEKVRKCDDPDEAPEEPYDSRSLYERLKEQKMKKELEFEEAHKLKNLIRGLDDDEVHFLDLIDQHKYETEKKQQLEIEKELEDYRKQVSAIHEKSYQKVDTVNVRKISKLQESKSSQKLLLKGIIKKPVIVTHKVNQTENTISKKRKLAQIPQLNSDLNKKCLGLNRGVLKCVAVLPGIGRYRDSSDSEISSDSEEEISNEKYDLCGRKQQKKCELE